MNKIRMATITGMLANIARDMVHLTENDIETPHRNMAKMLNMLPNFSPVAF